MEVSRKTKFQFSAKTIGKFVKVVKPMLKLMRRKQRTNSVTPSTCNYDVVESAQNDLNETELFQLQFTFMDDEAGENSKNERLEERLLESVRQQEDSSFGIQTIVEDQITVRPVVQGTYFAIPVHFVENGPGQFAWAPLSDVDVCRRGDDTLTYQQTPQQQTPILAV